MDFSQGSGVNAAPPWIALVEAKAVGLSLHQRFQEITQSCEWSSPAGHSHICDSTTFLPLALLCLPVRAGTRTTGALVHVKFSGF